MLSSIVGTKQAMTQAFTQGGRRIGGTKIVVEPNLVVGIKTQDRDGYNAVQLGYGTRKSITKPLKGILAKNGVDSQIRLIKEVRVQEVSDDISVGSTLSLDQVLKPGDIVSVKGTSKGKGFAGGIKRWNFSGGPKTHGQSDRHRAPGSIGSGTTPGRVLKGKHMAGHLGNQSVTVTNLVVLAVEKDALVVSGSVPGSRNSTIVLTKTGESKAFDELQSSQDNAEKADESSKDQEVTT